MPATNTQSGTRIDEVADQVYQISTSVPPGLAHGGFSYNQYLVADDEPLLFHRKAMWRRREAGPVRRRAILEAGG